MLEQVTQGEKETFAFAREFAKKLTPGDVVCLSGELGVGKTIFTKGVCDFFGVQDIVNSPTFTIVNEYDGADGMRIYHFDMYRIEDEDELVEIGFDDYLNQNAVCLIEWPEQAQNSLPAHRFTVTIARDLTAGDDRRRITVEEPY